MKRNYRLMKLVIGGRYFFLDWTHCGGVVRLDGIELEPQTGRIFVRMRFPNGHIERLNIHEIYILDRVMEWEQDP